LLTASHPDHHAGVKIKVPISAEQHSMLNAGIDTA
jgi:hypothetical protein